MGGFCFQRHTLSFAGRYFSASTNESAAWPAAQMKLKAFSELADGEQTSETNSSSAHTMHQDLTVPKQR